MKFRFIEEKIFKILMICSIFIVVGSLILIFTVIVFNGVSSISVEMLTQSSSPRFYLGPGGGGILNAIVGSLLLALPATAIAFLIGICVALFLQRDFIHPTISNFFRLCLDILWGVPSIVYGIFCMTIMFALGMSTSLLFGIIALTLLEIPIITRSIDESIKMVPISLKESAYSLGSTKFETAIKVVRRQALPGIIAGVLLGLGRGIGDAASILLTVGDSNFIPDSLFSSTAALPTMILNLLSMPDPNVQHKAYAVAFVLLLIVLGISIISRALTKKSTKYIIK
ncbi:MAG: phosphate ABC transporter permease PstA [Candidatus Thermoplasmatota archaeon]|nr:phosphate ABC transporter permease PstA [Candidatus Thermoplasmatota archaeon]